MTTHRPEPGPDADIDAISEDIERTRQEVGETVQALTAKLDVKARVTDAVTEPDGSLKRAYPVAAVVATMVITLAVVVRRRRRSGDTR